MKFKVLENIRSNGEKFSPGDLIDSRKIPKEDHKRLLKGCWIKKVAESKKKEVKK